MNSTSSDYREQAAPYADISEKVKGMIMIRLLISVMILITLGISQYSTVISEGSRNSELPSANATPKDAAHSIKLIDFFTAIAVTLSVISLVYLIYFTRCANMHFFAHIQFTMDLLIETMIIYFLGGSTCPFTFLYVMTIIGSSIVLGGNSSLYFASFCSIFYLWLVLAGFVYVPIFGYLLPIKLATLSARELGYFLTANLGGFLAVGFLSKVATGSLQNATDLLILHTHQYEDLRFRHNYIIQSIQSGLMTLNLEQQITLLNKEGEKLLGVAESQVKGHSLEILFADRITRRVRKLINGQEISRVYQDDISYKKLEQNIPLRFTISLLTDENNQKRGILLLFQDVAQLRKLEMQRQMTERWAAVAELASSIAHEIRNPLAALTGSIELLRVRSGMDGREQKLMNVVLRESTRLDSLITDFLNYSRPMSLSFDNRDLNEILEETLTVIRAGYSDPSPITFRFSSTLKECRARIDRERITQVFWNLIRNAQEAMPDGGVLEIQTSYSYFLPFASTVITKSELDHESESIDQKTGLRYAWVKIADTGMGINPENLKSIFNPFTSYKPRGTGLGLAISYRIVEGHNGHIAVETEVGKGTAFHVLLPTEQIEREVVDS